MKKKRVLVGLSLILGLSVILLLTGCFQACPVASIKAMPVSGHAPLAVQFSGYSDSKCTVDYNWNFGDGSSNSGKNVSHIYNEPGTYEATLVVTTSSCMGCCYSNPALVTITVTERPAPKIKGINIDPTPSLCVNTSGVFSASIDHQYRIVSYRWSMSDGRHSSCEVATFNFREIGHKTVTLVIEDEYGQTATLSRSFNVVECCPPCPEDSCLDRLQPSRATVRVCRSFEIQAVLDCWPCYETCGLSDLGVVADPGCGCWCDASIHWSLFVCGRSADVGEDYEVVSIWGEYGQYIRVRFLVCGEWSAKAVLAYGGDPQGSPAWGHYTVKD